MLACFQAMTCRLNANQLHLWLSQIRVEQTDGIGAAANTCHGKIRLTTNQRRHLHFGFFADYTLEIAHNLRIRMRACGGAQNIECGVHIRHPVAHRFVQRVFQGFGATVYGHHCCAQ